VINAIPYVAVRTVVAAAALACAAAIAGCPAKHEPSARAQQFTLDGAGTAAQGVRTPEAVSPDTATPVEAVPKPATLPPLSGANANLRAAQPKLATSVFSVTGMKDAKSAAAIEAALIKLPGVITVSADNVAGLAKVQYDPAKVTCAQLIAAMKKLGCTAKLEPATGDCCGECGPGGCGSQAGGSRTHPSGKAGVEGA